MKSSFLKILLTFLVLLGAISGYSQDVQTLPKADYVVDNTGTLTGSQQNTLKQKLESYEKSKGSQVVVLIIPTTDPETIEQYGIRVGEAWKVGRSKVDDGVILIVAKDDREVRIEVGYGLEGAIPDAYTKRIIENIIVPAFRQGQFYQGIDDGVGAILALIDGEDLPGVTSSIERESGMEQILPVAIFIMFILVSILRGLVKNKGVKFGVAVVIFVLAWLFSGVLIVAIVLGIMSIFFMFLPGGRGRGGTGFGGGFGGGFSSGGGFSGGGFSGGGGGFGGGGASGGW